MMPKTKDLIYELSFNFGIYCGYAPQRQRQNPGQRPDFRLRSLHPVVEFVQY